MRSQPAWHPDLQGALCHLPATPLQGYAVRQRQRKTLYAPPPGRWKCLPLRALMPRRVGAGGAGRGVRAVLAAGEGAGGGGAPRPRRAHQARALAPGLWKLAAPGQTIYFYHGWTKQWSMFY